MSFEVVATGLSTSLQDLGRPGWGASGLAPGGALDLEAHRLANWLVGNSDFAATLEIAFSGPRLRTLAEVEIALAGADFELSVDAKPVRLLRPIWVRAGAEIAIGRPHRGCRAAMAVGGGFDAPEVLGSRSWSSLAGLGLAIERGQQLPTTPRATPRQPKGTRQADWAAPAPALPDPLTPTRLRLLPGPAWHELSTTAGPTSLGSPWRVGTRADRMALALELPDTVEPLRLRDGAERQTEPVAFGTIQLPPDSRPLILLADRQTTGGYPRLGEVASVDRSLLAQLRPHDLVELVPIEWTTAIDLAQVREAELERLRLGIERRRGLGSSER